MSAFPHSSPILQLFAQDFIQLLPLFCSPFQYQISDKSLTGEDYHDTVVQLRDKVITYMTSLHRRDITRDQQIAFLKKSLAAERALRLTAEEKLEKSEATINQMFSTDAGKFPFASFHYAYYYTASFPSLSRRQQVLSLPTFTLRHSSCKRSFTFAAGGDNSQTLTRAQRARALS